MKTLAAVLSQPAQALSFTPRQWQVLLTEARQARMVARLHYTLLKDLPALALPTVVAEVFAGTGCYVSYLQHRARYEVSELSAETQAADYPVVLLKGAAYIMEGIEAGEGRGLSDIDVLVPHAALADIERRLTSSGWRFSDDLSDYDQTYYREMAHELPPMRHFARQFELDVHHGILQPTHRLKPESPPWFEDIVPLGDSGFFRLSRPNQVLHSATHLFMSDELRGGLRDLHDIVLLCRRGETEDPHFWNSLLQRAIDQGLQRPIYYAVYCAQKGLDLAVPPTVQGLLAQLRPVGPAARLAEGLFLRRFFSSPTSRFAGMNKALLFLRSHWIRMPPLMLMRHLSRKAMRRGKL